MSTVAESTTKIMRDVVIALLPALVVSALLFGWSVLGVTALSVVCCVVFEYLIQRFMLRGAPTVGNLSAVVTGVLAGLQPSGVDSVVDRRDRRFRGHRHRQDDLRRSGQEPVQPRAGRACLPADRLSRPDDVVPAAGRCRGRCLFGCYAAGGGQVRGGVGLGDRLSGHALRIDSRARWARWLRWRCWRVSSICCGVGSSHGMFR